MEFVEPSEAYSNASHSCTPALTEFNRLVALSPHMQEPEKGQERPEKFNGIPIMSSIAYLLENLVRNAVDAEGQNTFEGVYLKRFELPLGTWSAGICTTSAAPPSTTPNSTGFAYLFGPLT